MCYISNNNYLHIQLALILHEDFDTVEIISYNASNEVVTIDPDASYVVIHDDLNHSGDIPEAPISSAKAYFEYSRIYTSYSRVLKESKGLTEEKLRNLRQDRFCRDKFAKSMSANDLLKEEEQVSKYQ
jgi:hypothetical protein